MNVTPLFDFIEDRLLNLPEGGRLEVPVNTLVDAFSEEIDYDRPTSLGLSVNEILILSGNRPMPTPECRLEEFCKRHQIMVRKSGPHEHWVFVRRTKLTVP